MEDQTTWRGHAFTLFVFAGIVVLASIFFILGMLVGRAQGQKAVAAASDEAAVKADSQPAPKKDDLLPRDDSPKRIEPAFEPPPAPRAPLPAPIARSSGVNYQVAALRKVADAEKLLKELKKAGFSGVILAPAANDAKPLFRVQVGPFEDPSEAQDAKKRLEAAGYRPILKK
jgi:cell division septation protein DedD